MEVLPDIVAPAPRPRRRRVAWVLVVGALAAGGCTSAESTADPKAGEPAAIDTVPAWPSRPAGQWNAGLQVLGYHASGRARFTYADGTARTVRFSGVEDEVTETSVVSVGQSVSVTVTVEGYSPGRPRGAVCTIFEADYGDEGMIPLVTQTDDQGPTFTCRWTNDGTLDPPSPVR